MKLDHRNRQTIQDAPRFMGYIHRLQHDLTNEIESLYQVSPPPIETALGRNIRKQVAVLLPIAEHFSFHIPAPAFAN